MKSTRRRPSARLNDPGAPTPAPSWESYFSDKEVDDLQRVLHYVPSLRPELPDILARLLATGAVPPFRYQGVGQTGFVACDARGVGYKVARALRPTNVQMLADEAEWLRVAGAEPALREHVARVRQWHPAQAVIERECVRAKPSDRRRPPNVEKLWKLHKLIERVMLAYGWGAPEFKEDSYVETSGQGAVLVDAGFVHRAGSNLARDVARLHRDPRATAFDRQMARGNLRLEYDRTIPRAVGTRLHDRLATHGNPPRPAALPTGVPATAVAWSPEAVRRGEVRVGDRIVVLRAREDADGRQREEYVALPRDLEGQLDPAHVLPRHPDDGDDLHLRTGDRAWTWRPSTPPVRFVAEGPRVVGVWTDGHRTPVAFFDDVIEGDGRTEPTLYFTDPSGAATEFAARLNAEAQGRPVDVPSTWRPTKSRRSGGRAFSNPPARRFAQQDLPLRPGESVGQAAPVAVLPPPRAVPAPRATFYTGPRVREGHARLGARTFREFVAVDARGKYAHGVVGWSGARLLAWDRDGTATPITESDAEYLRRYNPTGRVTLAQEVEHEEVADRPFLRHSFRTWEDSALTTERDRLRGVLRSSMHTLDDVRSGRHPVGLEGRGGKELDAAEREGLFVDRRHALYARDAASAAPVQAYFERGGVTASPALSELLGYTPREVDAFTRFLLVEEELRRRERHAPSGLPGSLPNPLRAERIDERSEFDPAAREGQGATIWHTKVTPPRLSRGHFEDPKTRAATTVAARVTERSYALGGGRYGHTDLLGKGNFGIGFRVDGDDGAALVKIASPYDLHERVWTSDAQTRNLRHEAGVANELRPLGFTLIPEAVYTEFGEPPKTPALVREYGEPPGRITGAEYGELERQLVAIEREHGWHVVDDLVPWRRPDHSLFIGDVGFWRPPRTKQGRWNSYHSDLSFLLPKLQQQYLEGLLRRDPPSTTHPEYDYQNRIPAVALPSLVGHAESARKFWPKRGPLKAFHREEATRFLDAITYREQLGIPTPAELDDVVALARRVTHPDPAP